MKQKILIAFLLFLPFKNFIYSQEEIESQIYKSEFFIKKSLFQKKQILNLLFDGNLNSEGERISWKPFPTESIETSLNSKCYTNIDSILYYQLDTLKYALVILRTVKMNNISDSMEFEQLSMADPATVGLALFIERENNWELHNFERSLITIGQAGYIPPYQIVNISKTDMAFSLKEEEHKDLDVFEYIFSLDSKNFAKEIFSYAHFKRLSDYENDKTTFQITNMILNSDDIFSNSNETNFYSITLSTKNVDYSDDQENIQSSFNKNYVFINNKYELK